MCLFDSPLHVAQWLAAFQAVMARRPFYIDAMGVMPYKLLTSGAVNLRLAYDHQILEVIENYGY